MNLKENEGIKNSMGEPRLYNKLGEIRELLFTLCVIGLRKAGLTQRAIAKTLKSSKTTINTILKDTRIGEE